MTVTSNARTTGSTAKGEADVPNVKAQSPAGTGESDPLVEEDLLVEDVSIDGMCGVY
jgi:mycofactocin precursor